MKPIRADGSPQKIMYVARFKSSSIHQMARLLKCRGPGLIPKVSPPSSGMYILSHEDLAECVSEASRRQK